MFGDQHVQAARMNKIPMSKRSALTRLRKILAYVPLSRAAEARAASPPKRISTRSTLTLPGKAANLWHDILEEALKQNKLPSLVERALEEYPENPTWHRPGRLISPIL